MSSDPEFPVHEKLTVHNGKTIYRTEDWWKAVVLYSIDKGDPGPAIYLWHNEENGWTQKNKYRVKTVDAWASDIDRVERFLKEVPDGSVPDDLPVSDYYHVATADTAFKTDDWWKAVVVIDQKGGYDTHEVIIYVWQHQGGRWRRRQKYAIKDLDDWQTERRTIDELLDRDDAPATTASTRPTPANEVTEELNFLEDEIRDLAKEAALPD